MKFNLAKYQIPDPKEVDWSVTKSNFEVFLNAYKASRERVGHPRLPKVTQTFSLVPPGTTNRGSGQAEILLIQREEALEEFKELHELFVKGYSAISHAKPDKSERRKKIFFLRYVNGLQLQEIMDRLYIGRETASTESRTAMLQFCHELELTVLKSEMGRSEFLETL